MKKKDANFNLGALNVFVADPITRFVSIRNLLLVVKYFRISIGQILTNFIIRDKASFSGKLEKKTKKNAGTEKTNKQTKIKVFYRSSETWSARGCA